jgi:signal transduction histidine kinase
MGCVSRREWADDALRAAASFGGGLALLVLVPTLRTVWWPGTPPSPVWEGVAVLAVACSGEVLRRARPLVGLLAGALAVLAGITLVGDTHLGVSIVAADLLFCAVLNGPVAASRALLWIAGTISAGLALTSLVTEGTQAAVLMLINTALLMIPVMWGREVRHHRDRADAERERGEQARADAVAAERARMARDLHDVVAGQLSGIAIQSEAALTVPDADPATLRRVLADVRRDSVASLGEMRAMIGLLRADGAPEPRTAPAGLNRLDALLDAGRSHGLVIDVDDRRPTSDPVPAAVDLAAYRIVQESLTNAAKHAPGSAVRLALRREPDALVVELENDLVPAAPSGDGTGSGLTGLRERAAAVGGVVEAGARNRTWTVRARLPADR